MANERILVVDDEEDLAKIVSKYLRNEGFEVEIARDGSEALKIFDIYKPQLVVLDIMLPKIDGMEVCRVIRSKSLVPVIMLSAKTDDLNKVLSLGLGADDYITKPFSPMELVARVKAHVRRYINYEVNKIDDNNIIKINDLEIDTLAYAAKIKENDLNLTSKEFEILKLLCTNKNQVFSKEQIYEKVWGFNEYGEINAVVVYIKRLREKLGKYEMDYIKTVWGVGYKFEAK